MKRKKIITLTVSIILGIPIILFVLINLIAGAGRKMDQPIQAGNIEVPVQRTFRYRDTSAFQQNIIKHWTKGKPRKWTEDEKINFKNARIVLGCLLAGERLEEMNQYIMDQKATGVAGSPWLLNPRGDYDFNAMGFTAVFFLFKDRPDRLYPETKAHLAQHILTIEGDGFIRNVPYLFIEDSENHILMAESSRYLKNQWLWEEGNHAPEYDNPHNGVEAGLKSFLEEIDTYGFYEFNSAPYLGYAYSALLNLAEFSSGDIQALSVKLLDRINWEYALSSFQFKHFPPHRRRFGKSFKKNIDSDYHTVMLKVWASLYDDSLEVDISRGEHHALWASMMSYRPADKVMEWTLEKPHPYFVQIGHGYNSCGEIYSGGKHFLLSAGGANQGRRSLIVSKPITLFLEDSASELNEVFHMYGPGEAFKDWNNTGVYRNFACAKGAVQIPEGKTALAKLKGWLAFEISPGEYVCIFSQPALGLMVIMKGETPAQCLEKITTSNPDATLLNRQFRHPDGTLIEYDLDAPKDIWVIRQVNGEALNRQFDQWPHIEGDI